MKKVVSIYNKAGIPNIRLYHVREKILMLIQTHKNIIQLKNRTSPTEECKRRNFTENVSDKLFDMMPLEVESEGIEKGPMPNKLKISSSLQIKEDPG